MDIRSAERYILAGYKSEKAAGYRIKLRIFTIGALWCLAAVLLLIWGLEIRFISAGSSLLGFTIRFGLHPVIYIVVVLLIYLYVLFIVKYLRRGNKESSENADGEILQQENAKKEGIGWGIAATGGALGLLGAGIAQDILRWRPDFNRAMGIILCVFFVLLMLLFSILYFHKFYLIIKYCPYLKRFEDRRYPEDEGAEQG